MRTAASVPRMRGAPLIVLALVFGAWAGGRAMLWENPFPPIAISANGPPMADASPADAFLAAGAAASSLALLTEAAPSPLLPSLSIATIEAGARFPEGLFAAPQRSGRPLSPALAAGHQLLMAAGFGADWGAMPSPTAMNGANVPPRPAQGNSPFLPPDRRQSGTDRWSLEAFAFYRAGSNSNSISQGRVPVYGASQIAVNLQRRLTPSSRHDPRGYVRAYRAFVPDGENEIAAGVSARPIAGIPLRTFAEVRVTENGFGTDVRPAAYAVTEVAPLAMPLDFTLETYAGAGYVGGKAATPFVDGQAALTREVASFVGHGAGPVRVSLGAGSWGGAQKDAERLDVGPTMRVDLQVGDVPARLSLDWRERVAGDAAPTSGLAATLSTRF